MAIRGLALKAGASSPRRFVSAVDRRAVVDQATTVADEMKERLDEEKTGLWYAEQTIWNGWSNTPYGI